MTSHQKRVQQTVFEVLLNQTTTLGVPQMTDISDKVVELLAKRGIMPSSGNAEVAEAKATMAQILNANHNQATSEKGQATIAGGLFAIAEAIREAGSE